MTDTDRTYQKMLTLLSRSLLMKLRKNRFLRPKVSSWLLNSVLTTPKMVAQKHDTKIPKEHCWVANKDTTHIFMCSLTCKQNKVTSSSNQTKTLSVFKLIEISR